MPHLDSTTYWRLRYLQSEAEKALLQAATAEGRFRAALEAAGVPLDVEHQWRDVDTSVVPVGELIPAETRGGVGA
jgi:hypothetical protein